MQRGLATVSAEGQVSFPFNLDSGVRQGCPLAPLLYAITTIPLINLFDQATAAGRLQPVFKAQGVPILINLYTDDVSLFLPWNLKSFTEARALLDQFCSASNSKINAQKSQILPIGCSGSLPTWTHDLDWTVLHRHDTIKYLGFPFGPEASRSQLWTGVLSGIQKRLHSWDEHFLPFEGRLVVLRSILSALPQYVLAFLLLSCREEKMLERLYSNFLWGCGDEGRPKDSLGSLEGNHAVYVLGRSRYSYAPAIAKLNNWSWTSRPSQLQLQSPVKSFIGMLQNQAENSNFLRLNRLWRLDWTQETWSKWWRIISSSWFLPRDRVWLWRIAFQAFYAGKRTQYTNHPNTKCHACKADPETVVHLLFTCRSCQAV
ncbi:hypothetical protein R1sor_022506 [Riccia sorocarpa]|uniref:Reverse transcriptase domain-containing protein n=1 Tax=Riccia sorocarpa TaxID=122646 RepID=A0ABD3GN77_9MARC